MKKKWILIVVLLIAIGGCDKAEKAEKKSDNFIDWVLNIDDRVQIPTKAIVFEKRDEVLAGMSGQEIKRLRENIKALNLSYEHRYLNDNFFERLENPEDLYWNYIEKSGEIQIGWAIDGEYNESCGMSEEEWELRNRRSVWHHNNMDAENFIKLISELQASMKTDLLDKDFNNLISNMAKAKETHEVEYVEEVYHILHDMDYFLLRYGLEDVAPYTDDDSTVTLYYGALEVYN